MQIECIFTEDRFAQALYNYSHFDVITYSVMGFDIFLRRPIKRLIYGVGTPPITTLCHVQVTHCHAKLWLCYNTKPNCPPDVYVGSANATDMTILDLMIKVNSRQAATLIGYFNLLWNINYKTK